MKLGIKTTGGVSKLKTKTTEGVTKAVECACCKCDPYALWGPGYDTKPSEIQMLGYTLQRISSCQWMFGDGFEMSEDYLVLTLDADYTFYEYDHVGPVTFAIFYAQVPGSTEFFVIGEAMRTGGDYDAPYGNYTVVTESLNEMDISTISIGDTFTISP